MNRLFELALVTTAFFLLTGFITYVFFLEGLCDRYSNNTNAKNLTQEIIISNTAGCKDTFVCGLTGLTITDSVNITDWKCAKKRVGIYEEDFYVKKIKNFLQYLNLTND